MADKDLAQALGSDLMERAVELFYVRVLDDPMLKLHFDGVDVAAKKRSFKDYVMMLIGEGQYQGPSMYEAHRGRQITDLGFETFVASFIDVLRELKVPAERVDLVQEKLLALNNEVVDSFVWPGTHFYKQD